MWGDVGWCEMSCCGVIGFTHGYFSLIPQALNNLQSTHTGFGFVNAENVFKVMCQHVVFADL